MAKRDMDLKFFKVYLPCQSSLQLRIPPAFVKQLNDDFPTEATLRDWSGNSWHMEIEEDEDGVFFKHGWEIFVKDNSLEHGDFVVFTYEYDGNSVFDVKVYGKNGCIKDEGRTLQRKSTEGSLTTSTKSTGSCVTNVRRPERVVSKSLEPSIANANKRRSGRVVSKNIELSIANVNKKISRRVVSKNIEPNMATYPSEFAMTANPHFIASLHSLRGRYHLNIPTRFLVKNGIELEPEMMLRDQNGTKWPVKVIVRKNGRYDFGIGWNVFWMENDLKKHDKIRFEFVFLNGKKKRLSKEIPFTIARGKGRVMRNKK